MFERLSAFTRGRWASVARVALAAAGLAAFSPHLAAEGTRTLHPAAGDGSTGNRGVMDVSNTVNANVVRTRQFLYVYAEAGEVILLGSRNRSDGGDIFVYNPQSFGAKGNETIPGTADFTCSSQSGRGTIASRAEELAGPNSADLSATVTNGFNPCWYAAPSTGIYGVRFTAATCSNADGCNNNTAAIATPTILNADRVAAWDVTVRGSQNSLADLNGRVFTYAWTVYLQSNSRFLRNALYYVSSDGFRYKQTFRNLDPNRATFYANSRGFVDAGAPLYRDIRGANQNVNSGNYVTAGITAQAPEYPIFFSDVMPGGANATEVNRVLTALAIPHAPSQPMLVNPSFNGNVGGNTSTVSAGGVFTFDTQNTLTYEIVISGAPGCIPNDFNPANVCNRVLTGTALTGSHTVLWDGLDNNGNPFPAGTYDFRIYGRNGEIHFPMLDVEGNNQGGPTLDKLNGFQPADRYTVYYDDRGYRTNNNTLVGVLNGHLCGAASLIVPPSPDHSLVGANSNDANFGGSGNYYRVWGGSNDANTDCSTTGGANQYFATAKGLDLWALERSVPEVLPIVIIPLTTGVDVGTQVSVTSNVLPGDTAYGNFVFTNAGDVTATGVTYGVTIGNPLNPVTCPAAVNFTLLPPGVTATWNPAPLCTVTFAGMPTTLAPGQSLIFNFNYVVVPSNPGPIPVTTTIGAGNETCTGVGCAPNTANAQTVVARPVISVVKNSSPVPGTLVDIGDTITYTLSATIANAPLTAVLTLTDTLGPGLTYGGVSSSHPSFTCTGSLTCTLPIGTAIGTYTVTYTATVNNTAVGSVANNVTATGGGGDNPPTCTTCTTTHPLTPAVTVSKASNPASGVAVSAGQTITYTVTAVVSNAALTSPLVLTDTLSGNQTFGTVTNPGSFSCTGTVQCTLPTGTAPGTYTVEYTATVNANATGTVGNNVVPTGGTPGGPTCTAPGACETSHPLKPSVTLNKSANPASGSIVALGETITYTVNVVVANAALLSNVVVTDVLDPGLTFGSVTSSTGFTGCTGALTCTLPTGTAPGTYTLVYTATVAATATTSVNNSVTATGGNDPGDPGNPQPVCTTPGGCQTTHPLNPVVTVSKASNPASGVAVSAGQTITYTVTAVVSNAALTSPLVLTDTLSANQTFGSVTNPGSFSCTGTVQCTLPTGTAPGTYTVEYTATVNADATGTVGNNVVPTGGTPGGPTCTAPGACETSHPLTPAVTVSKASNPASGVAVSAGQTITYTVTAVVSNAALTSPLVLTDTLSANQSFGSVTNPGSFSCTGTVQCTLPTGTAPGTYTVEYTATVNADATGTVGNNVVPTGGTPGGPTCTAPGACETSHPLTPVVTVSKASNPASGVAVSAGQTITYTVTAVVSNAALTSPLVLTDTLSANQTFGSVTNPGSFSCTGTVQCTLPTGTAPGTYTVEYTATVNANATGTVGNNVVPTGGTPGGPTCTAPGACETSHPLNPAVTVSKASNPASGTAVVAGQTITYTVTVVVANATTNEVLTLADTLSGNQTFGTVDTGSTHPAFTCGGSLTCTLPAGTAPGTYTLVYTATVNTNATGPVGNNVAATNPPGGDPDPVCTTPGGCQTTHPLNPAVTVSKASNPASGTAVSAGQTITYTLTAVVSNAALTSPLVLTDTLSANQTFGTVTNPGSFSCTGTVQCTLPTGTAPGTYTVEYTATVNANATGTVGNNVVPTGGTPGGPSCSAPGACETSHPLKPSVTLNKSANPASGSIVALGETITYTVNVVVANAALLSNVVVTDVLDPGLTFGSVTSSTGFTGCTGALTCTLPTGTAPGTYTLVYTATVAATATTSVNNSVTATGGNDPGDPDNPQPVCTTPGGCQTSHPLAANVTLVKAGPVESGGTRPGIAEPGETLTWTITLSNSGGVAFTDYDFTENVPNGATLTSVTGAGVTACATPVVGAGTCAVTVASVPASGSTTVTIVFTVANPIPAGVTSIVNLVNGGDTPPDCPSPNVCSTTTPTEGRVAIAKTVADANGNGIAEPGETLTWTITLTNDGGSAVSGYGLTDPLDANTTFVSATNGGSHAAGVVTWTGLTVPPQVGATPGTLVLTVVTTVNTPIPDGVRFIANLVHETGGTPPDCSATPTPANCASIPTAANVTVAKSLSGESITADGIAEPGEQLTYTITLRNHGGTVASNVIVNETVPLHTTFVSGTPGWSCAAGSPAGTACDSVVNVPAADAGGSPGVTTLTFTVQVVDPLPAGVTQIANAVTIDDGTPPNCAVNPTHPACVITPTINLNLVKSVESVTATGPGTYWVAYRIDLANTGGSPVTYTLTDTPDFTPMGVTVTGNGLAATTSGTLNPALPGGAFAVANGTAVQISAAGVTLAAGATHSYTVRIPIAVSAGSLGNAVCTGAPGNGLYNRASVTGSFARDSSTCAPVSGEQPLIRLVKSVRLGVDANGDHYGNVGDVLHYTFAISNPGTVTLSAIDLIDPRVTDLQCDATTAYGEPMRVLRGDELFIGVFEELLGGSLVPGDSITCSATYTITAQDVLNRRVVNSATTHGAGTDGQVVMSTSTAIYTNIR